MSKEYKGILTLDDDGDGMDILFLAQNRGDTSELEPLAKQIDDDIEDYGNFLSVKYYLSDEPKPLDELKENEIRKMVGAAEAEYGHTFSEYTGYLWTNEEIKVGGHDLLEELKESATDQGGKYCHLIIEYSRRPLD